MVRHFDYFTSRQSDRDEMRIWVAMVAIVVAAVVPVVVVAAVVVVVVIVVVVIVVYYCCTLCHDKDGLPTLQHPNVPLDLGEFFFVVGLSVLLGGGIKGEGQLLVQSVDLRPLDLEVAQKLVPVLTGEFLDDARGREFLGLLDGPSLLGLLTLGLVLSLATLKIGGDLSKVLLCGPIRFRGRNILGPRKDGLDGVGGDEVLVGDEVHDGLLRAGRDHRTNLGFGRTGGGGRVREDGLHGV